MGYHNTAQICLNGHVITENHPSEFSEKFCSKCGAETISSCLNCNTAIRGEYKVEGVYVIGSHEMPVPAYCHNCGQPFPWTEDAIEATRILIDEEDMLSNDDKEKLKQSLPDIISETPRTALAVNRMKKACISAGSFLKDGLMQFASSFACELAKKHLGL